MRRGKGDLNVFLFKSGRDIGEEGTKMISKALKTNRTLTSLNLEYSRKEIVHKKVMEYILGRLNRQ